MKSETRNGFAQWGLGDGHVPIKAAVEFGTVRVTVGLDSVEFGSQGEKRFAAWLTLLAWLPCCAPLYWVPCSGAKSGITLAHVVEPSSHGD